MSPLRVFQGLYVVTFAVAFVIGLAAPEYIRWPMVALGVLLAIFGTCLVTNFLNVASETASKAETSRWTAPAFASVPLVRAMGVFFLLGGVAFATQALLVDNR